MENEEWRFEMLKKVVGYGVVGLLAVALVAGVVYILVRPAEVQAGQGPLGGQGEGRAAAVEPGTGYRGGGADGLDGGGYGRGQAGQGREAAGNAGNGGGSYGRGQGFQAGGDAAGAGDGVGLDHPADAWITVSGTVVAFDGDLTIETGEGEMVIHMGATWYWDTNGIALNVGDEVEVRGFYDGDEFEAGWIKSMETGAEIALRNETGRPLWAGRGRWGKRT